MMLLLGRSSKTVHHRHENPFAYSEATLYVTGPGHSGRAFEQSPALCAPQIQMAYQRDKQDERQSRRPWQSQGVYSTTRPISSYNDYAVSPIDPSPLAIGSFSQSGLQSRDVGITQNRTLPVEPPQSWRARPEATIQSRRRQAQSRELSTTTQHPTLQSNQDFALLYPHMSPYDPSCVHVSESPTTYNFARRATSQPSTPFGEEPQDGYLAPRASSARAPTFPPSTSRRTHTQGTVDATFTDESEFHLFAQATAGLGPEDNFFESNQWLESRRPERPLLQRSVSERVASPIMDTPTTIHALQSLATMPQSSYGRDEQWTSHRHRYGTSLTSDLPSPGVWFNPPYEQDEADLDAVDEEPPDYATSQAQAQAGQIAEAVRRAQELQRRWQQSR